MWRVRLGHVKDVRWTVLGKLNGSHAAKLAEHPVRFAKVRVVTAQLRTALRSDARDNRDRILAAARTAFATEGLDVPIREIARRAQVGPATVYRHFASKDALIDEAFARQMALCSEVVAEGLAEEDPWSGLRLVVEKVMVMHALDRGFARTFTSRLSGATGLADDRDRALSLLLRLIRRAKDSGRLRRDFVLEDLALALMANEGIRAETPQRRVAASRRFAALMLQSFHAHPEPAPLPPAVRLPLTGGAERA
jgi:AcrR family transcriptional regulator